MALITCPDCGKEISDLAAACPQCGRPKEKPVLKPVQDETRMTPQQILQQKLESAESKPDSKKSGRTWALFLILGIFLLLGMCTMGSKTTSTSSTYSSSSNPTRASSSVATFLNLNGFLCAETIDVRALAQEGRYEVRCIEYRGGSGTADYIVDMKSGTAFKR